MPPKNHIQPFWNMNILSTGAMTTQLTAETKYDQHGPGTKVHPRLFRPEGYPAMDGSLATAGKNGLNLKTSGFLFVEFGCQERDGLHFMCCIQSVRIFPSFVTMRFEPHINYF